MKSVSNNGSTYTYNFNLIRTLRLYMLYRFFCVCVCRAEFSHFSCSEWKSNMLFRLSIFPGYIDTCEWSTYAKCAWNATDNTYSRLSIFTIYSHCIEHTLKTDWHSILIYFPNAKSACVHSNRLSHSFVGCALCVTVYQLSILMTNIVQFITNKWNVIK